MNKNIAFISGRRSSVPVIANTVITETIQRTIKLWAERWPDLASRLREDVAMQKSRAKDRMYSMNGREFRHYALIPTTLYHEISIALEDAGDPEGRNWIAKPHIRDLFFNQFSACKLVSGGLQQTEG